MNTNLSPEDIQGIIRRRYKLSLFVFCVIFLISIIVAFTLPPIYRSRAMILIEGQQIHQDFVKSTVTSYAEERMQMITRQIMKYSQLKEIIYKFDLYPDLMKTGDLSGAVQKMKESISLEPVNFQEGYDKVATVAFELAYEGKEPVSVKKVTEALSELYIQEELDARKKQASATTGFLKKELENIKQQLKMHEDKISEFKSRHVGELPENTAFNMQNISKLEIEGDRITAKIRSLEERKILLKGQLATTDPLNPIITEQGKVSMNPKERLKVLRLELLRMQSRLSDKHPDVRKIKSEIAKLESQVGGTDATIEKIKMLNRKRAQLAEMKGRLSDLHPDVAQLKKEVDMLSKQVSKLITQKAVAAASEQKPDNPVYINLLTQIAAVDSEIKSLRQESEEIDQNIESFRKKISKSPIIAKEYNELTLDLNNSKQKYNEILNKLMTAQVSQKMEIQQMGERFTILEHANMPLSPHKPNRIIIALLGFVLASGAAFGLAAVREGLDNTLKNEAQLASVSNLTVLSTISFVQTEEERRKKRKRYILAVSSAVLFVFIIFALIDQISRN
jgi:uncharacterized protein involved in exopolysaccharide biosynthesis